MMESKMFEYICETPAVLTDIINRREEITKGFVSHFKDVEIEQIYVIGSGTSYHAGLAAKLYLEELLGIKVFNMYPTQFAREEKVFNQKTLVIGMSQGGQSLSTVEGLDSARERGLHTAAVSETRRHLSLNTLTHQLRLKWEMKNAGQRPRATQEPPLPS